MATADKSAFVAQTPVPVSPAPELPHEAKPVSFRRRLQRDMGKFLLLLEEAQPEQSLYVSKSNLTLIRRTHPTDRLAKRIQWLRDLPNSVANDLDNPSNPPLFLVPLLGMPLGYRDLCLRSRQDPVPTLCLPFPCRARGGTFYPAVHTVLGGWYTKRELAKRACILFGSAFVESIFSDYLKASGPLHGHERRAQAQWLAVAVHIRRVDYLSHGNLGIIALPDLPSNTRVIWLRPEEKELALS
ncbi:uncharacterized protein BDW70DRAFT_158437 [Aspergillus foveolatus]|uniref:uncharacterized protein n=1 Tax=Aspergillus foveolatus TaxID=210207 RepID=UPI003CCE0573